MMNVDHLINLASDHFNDSEVIGLDGLTHVSADRTSQSYVVDESDPIAKKVKDKINSFLLEKVDNSKNWKDHIENTQIVKYKVGQEYKPHHDYFKDEYLKKVNNQRNYTIFIYLNDVKKGGETYFSKLDKKINPQKGSALFWTNCTDKYTCLEETLHQGLPPLEGEKYGMNVWIQFDKN